MMRMFLLGVLVVAAGCSKEPADNAATRYTSSLQNNVEKAEAAAEKANKAIAAAQQNMSEMANVE